MIPRLSLLLLLACVSAGIAENSSSAADHLRPGDLLNISVHEHEELGQSVRISRKGTIRLPLCGTFSVTGMTAEELSKDLSTRFQKAAIENAFATVMVEEFAPRTVFVIGRIGAAEQGRGMQLEVPPIVGLSALQAICSAGGFAEDADLSKIVILRTSPGKTERERLLFNAAALMGGDPKAKDLTLLPGDTVIIPSVKPVLLLGHMASPGSLLIPPGTELTVTEVLAQGGGLSPDADRDKIVIVRRDDTGKQTLIPVDLDAEENGTVNKAAMVRPGDWLVAKRLEEIYVLGQVKSPGPIKPATGQTLTASKAIAMAGGFERSARSGKVLLVRDGKISYVNIKDVYDSEKELAQDKPLKPGDILMVEESLW